MIKHVIISSENIYVLDIKYRYTVVHDITERKCAEKALAEISWRFENIITGTHAGTWEWNVQSGETVFNDVWARIVGYSLEEVHHRIKNNMNTIMGLLFLQADKLKDSSAIAALNDSASRVNSMMVLYDKLYRSEGFRDLSLIKYLPDLVDEIIANFPGKPVVTIEKNIEDFILDAETLFNIGIIINELITNIMKYAFTGREKGMITLSSSLKDNHVTIILADDGIGIPEVISFESSTGFGMELVNMLVEQIKGCIHIERQQGTKFILEFNLKKQIIIH
ncbi:MAG: ATP-binding protein [Spirochaetaceae bacterium]|jgi:two-component sensor histidine kinase|nr:ATP-binding protein [Spirochaetaceae bacterium]